MNMHAILASFESLGLHLPPAKARAVAFLLDYQARNRWPPVEGVPGRKCGYCSAPSPVRTVKIGQVAIKDEEDLEAAIAEHTTFCAVLCLECQATYKLAHQANEKGIPMGEEEKAIWRQYRGMRKGG